MYFVAPKTKRRLIALIAASLGLFLIVAVQRALAEGEDVTNADRETAQAATQTESWDAHGRVLKMIEEWKRTSPVARGLSRRDDVLLVDGTATVSLPTDDKRWPKARALAYQKAFNDAMAGYVSTIRADLTVRLVRDEFEQDLDESAFTSEPEDSASSRAERLFEKIATLGERKLDQALAESGMSAEEIARLDPTEKKTVYSNRIKRQTTRQAFGSAAGLVPVQTFEAIDEDGNSAIGVAAVFSPRMRRLARQVAQGKSITPDSDRARLSIAHQLAEFSDQELVNHFGVRVYWDEKGYPTLVSFGQWGFSNERLDRRKKARRRNFASQQARNDAQSHLITFIRASTRFSDESAVGEDVEEALTVESDGTVGDTETVRLVDTIVKKANVTSQTKLTGMQTLRTWTALHPDVKDQEIVGAIVSWSPAREKAVRMAVADKPLEKPALPKQSTPRTTATRQSREDMGASDF